VDQLDQLGNQEVMETLANLARLVSVELQDLRVLVDSPELLVFLASKDTEVTLVWMELRERLELQEPRERVATLERTALPDPWVPVVFLVREVVPELLELLVLVVTMVCLVLLVPLDPLALLEPPVSQDPQEPRERLDLLAPVELREHKDPVERLVPLDLLALLELLATPVLMESLELKDLLGLLVLPVPQDSLAPADHPDLREPPGLWDPRDSLETLVFLDSKERLDPRESWAWLDPKEPPDPLVRRAREEPEESPAPPDPSDPLEREELLVTVVSQVRMVLLEPREPPVTEVFLVLLGLRVLEETPDALESLASPEPEVLLVVPEMLVPKEKLDPVVLPVRTVAPDPPVPRVLVDSLE